MVSLWRNGGGHVRGLVSCLAVFLVLLASCRASPLLFGSNNVTEVDLFTSDAVTPNEDSSFIFARQSAGNFYLRIMPLGASITRGSNDHPDLRGRGYRKFLRDKLRILGWKVNMVGSFRNGEQFSDNVCSLPILDATLRYI